MGKEIEHKYLVNDNSFISLASSCYTIKQGYICREKERTVRIRIKDEKAFIIFHVDVLLLCHSFGATDVIDC